MLKFNSNNIFVGYIKQLLNSFNLPKYRVYTREQQMYHDQRLEKIASLREVLKNLRLKWSNTRDKDIKEYYWKQIEYVSSELQEVENSPEEKDVIGTIYLNDYSSYAEEWSEGTPKITYPVRMNYMPYIKNNIIQDYVIEVNEEDEIVNYNGKWISRHVELDKNHDEVHHKDKKGYYSEKTYIYGHKYLNYTKNLVINNNIYDSYTHEYLGDYLRFQRDYNNLNLMSLYNCFSDRVCPHLDLSFTLPPAVKVSFNTKDPKYKIYMVPVKLFKEYTIAIDCSTDVEICCGIYGKYYNSSDRFSFLPSSTYTWYSNTDFNNPKLFSKLLDISGNDLIEISQNECDLKLFIKLPSENNSSIVVLEGNYVGYNDTYLTCNDRKDLVRHSNRSAINYEALYEDEPSIQLISPLQLLQLNTGQQVPFADKLLEYLMDNAITHLDENYDDIKRVQTVIDRQLKFVKKIDQADESYRDYSIKPTSVLDKIGFDATGLWSEKLNILLYDYMLNHYDNFSINKDLLGYCDKETEKYVHYTSPSTSESTTISNVDIYLDEEGKHKYE